MRRSRGRLALPADAVEMLAEGPESDAAGRGGTPLLAWTLGEFSSVEAERLPGLWADFPPWGPNGGALEALDGPDGTASPSAFQYFKNGSDRRSFGFLGNSRAPLARRGPSASEYRVGDGGSPRVAGLPPVCSFGGAPWPRTAGRGRRRRWEGAEEQGCHCYCHSASPSRYHSPDTDAVDARRRREECVRASRSRQRDLRIYGQSNERR